MPSRIPRALLAFAALIVIPEPVRADESVSSTSSSVVYGTDDRRDWYEIPTATMQTLATDSIVALVDASALDPNAPQHSYPPFADGWPTLSQYIQAAWGKPLCAGERFATQPSLAFCSGTLIDADLVLTAGHCMTGPTDCANTRFVFDYLRDSSSTAASISSDDIYSCRMIVSRAQTKSPTIDYAVVQLDRAVVGHYPANVRVDSTALTVGSGLVVIGMGSGLPMKFDDGGEVTNSRAVSRDVFIANTDTFGGNSGSGVFDDTGTLVGILIAGADDYVDTGSCIAVNVLPSTPGNELATYVFRALDGLCSTGYPSGLCSANPPAQCGDLFCTAGETAANCPVDCAGPHCGDGVCDATESSSNCPLDCSNSKSHGSGRCSAGIASNEPFGLEAVSMFAAAVALIRRRRK